jgi:hypothetical protein
MIPARTTRTAKNKQTTPRAAQTMAATVPPALAEAKATIAKTHRDEVARAFHPRERKVVPAAPRVAFTSPLSSPGSATPVNRPSAARAFANDR